jgi:hypothetical protein
MARADAASMHKVRLKRIAAARTENLHTIATALLAFAACCQYCMSILPGNEGQGTGKEQAKE